MSGTGERLAAGMLGMNPVTSSVAGLGSAQMSVQSTLLPSRNRPEPRRMSRSRRPVARREQSPVESAIDGERRQRVASAHAR
jgi:hypothetical protein